MVASVSIISINEIMPLNQIDIVMKTDVSHLTKYDYEVINCSLDWTRTPGFCSDKKLSLVTIYNFVIGYKLAQADTFGMKFAIMRSVILVKF